MKHAISLILGAGLLLMVSFGCRKESDALMEYDHNEELVFNSAESSFAAKFNIIWNGMNQYYALWDFEAQHGIDWDAVYDTYYPKFLALDQRGENETVTDEELKSLLGEVLNPLHDSHFHIDVYNHKTGSTVTCSPSSARVVERDDFNAAKGVTLHLGYYANPENGEVETDADGNPIALTCSTEAVSLINARLASPGTLAHWIIDRIAELEALQSPTDLEAFQLQQLYDLKEGLRSINGVALAEGLDIYNKLQAKYSFLNIPDFDYIDPAFVGGAGVTLKFALLKGNIAYLGLSSFSLTTFFDEQECAKAFDMSQPFTQKLVAQMKAVWQGWFDSIQTLHKAGTLGGVIIDLRSNGGGHMDDSQYVVGALTPGDYIHFGYQRFKRGTGRYEYSPMMEAHVITMSQPHEIITDVPVVVMVNCISVSMSETSALCAKTLPNGTIIGKRSFGAICALTGNSDHSYNYAGYIGEEGVTPVFGYLPSMASFTLDGKIIESEGLTPDIEVDLDIDQFKANGRDTQLDRALQFIRTGQ